MNIPTFFSFNLQWTSAVRRMACIMGAIVVVGCAHPISIEGKKVPERDTAWSTKKVAYVISDADKQKEVTTQGGGGDKISYFPYRDFERSLRATLSAVYADVSALKSVNDVASIKAANASLIFTPSITTTSSSPSLLTWPPTKFSISVTVNVIDSQGKPVARLMVTGNGAAEWDDFKGDFGLAGRRAVEDAAKALVDEIKRNEILK